MLNTETTMMLRQCAEEIRHLRRRLEEVEPKADAYDNMTAILRMIPRQSGGYGPDVLWMIEKHLAEIDRPVPDRSEGGA